MKRGFGFILVAIALSSFAEVPHETDENIYNKININNTIYSDSYVDGECQCCHFFGDKLNECLSGLDQEEVSKNFIALNARRIKQYLLSLSLQEYKEFLSIWTEEQWQEMVAQFEDAKKSVIPITRQEQIAIIEEAEAVPWLDVITGVGYIITKNGLIVAVFPNPVTAAFAWFNACREADEADKQLKEQGK